MANGELLFVYGSLRAATGHPMSRFLARRSTLRGTARMAGQLFDLGSYPGLTETFDPRPESPKGSEKSRGGPGSGGAQVLGECMELHDRTVLQELDRYEGCSPDCALPHDYHRVRRRVELQGGASAEAWVYLYRGSLERASPVVGGDWLAWLAERR